MTGLPPEARAALESAEASHAKYPHYAGHWRGPEWVGVQITRRVRTKRGLAFERGDVTLARRVGVDDWTAYSVRNGVDTMVPDRAVKALN